jgi:hypothetical protein
MAYGEIKVDTVTFTDGGIDKSVSISGLVQNPTFSGNITVTGTISGNTVQGQTVSGATVTGTTANFVSGVFTTQISGATITGNVGSFTTITGGTVTLTSGVFASGTAAAPSVSIGTTDNGLYSPGADQVAVATNGTGRLFVDASGNVGVGTSSVNALLEVNNSTAGGEVQRIEGNYDGSGSVTLTNWRRAGGSVAAALKYNDDSSPLCMSIGTTTSHEFRIRTADTDAITIDASQRVGIGTSSPTGTSVAANFYSYGADNSQFVIGAARGTVASPTTLNSSDTIGGVYFRGHDGTSFKTGAQIQAQIDGITPSSDLPSRLVFSTTADGASSPTERLRITSAGLVGIGTSSPAANLEVFGDTADVVLTSVTNNNATGANKSLNCGVGGATAFSVPPWPNSGFIDSATTNGLALGSSSSTGSVRLYTGTSREERLRITSAGLVGIGTSSPTTTLHVVGSSGSGAIQIGNAVNTQYHYINFGGSASTNDAWQLGRSPSGGIGPTNGFYLYDLKSSATRLAVDTSGNVGIGTTSPGAPGEGAGLRVHSYLQRTEYYSPAGYYAGSFGYTNNTQDRVWLAVDSNYSQGSAVSAGIFLSSYHQDTGGGHCGYTIKDLRADGALVFSRVTTAASLGTAATETERARIDSSGRLLVGTSSYTGNATIVAQGHSGDSAGPAHLFLKTGSTSPVSGGDLGYLFFGDANTSGGFGAWILGQRDGGTWTSGSSMPGRLQFATTADGASSPTERMRITSDAYVRLAAGTGGIQFNGDTAAANALDDYEEGTWTPNLTGGGGGAYTYAFRTGIYTKVGNTVTVQCDFQITGTTTPYSGSLQVDGLPYICRDVRAVGSMVPGSAITYSAPYTFVFPSVELNQAFFYINGGNLTSSVTTGATVSNGIMYGFSVTYKTS